MASRDIRRMRARQAGSGSVAESMEKRKESHPLLYGFSVVILVIIVVTFIGSPVAGRIGSIGSIVFGRYQGREISFYSGSYFDRQRQAIAQQLRGQDASDQSAIESQIQSVWYQAFLDTALHTAMLVQAERSGLQVSEVKLDTDLATNSAYLDENGKFSEILYNKTPMSERVATRKLRREALVVAQYSQDISTEVKTGSKEQAFITAMAGTERSFRFVSWPFASFPPGEVVKFAEANRSKFRKIKFSRITVKSGEREASEIHRKLLDKTSSFEELAKAHSKDTYASAGGDMGWRYLYDLEQEFDQKEDAIQLLGLKAGEVSEVTKGPAGWMIWRCDAEVVDPDLADTATLDAVRSYLERYERGKVEDYFLEKAGQLARRAVAAGFDTAAREASLTVNTTDYFPINLQNTFVLSPVQAIPESATPASAAYSEEFFQQAFALGKDQASSQPIVLDDQIVVLKLAGERPLQQDKLAMMDRVVAALAGQSLQNDFQQELLGGGKLESNFDEAFSRYVLPKRQ